MGDICAGRLKKETHREIAGGLVTWGFEGREE
jgi:hypothetical protein